MYRKLERRHHQCARFCDNHDANELLTPSPSYLYSNVNEPLYYSVTIVTEADKRIRHSRRIKSSRGSPMHGWRINQIIKPRALSSL